MLGILGLFCGILAVVALVMGNNAMGEINRNPAAYSNQGMVQAGRILGIIGTVLWVLGLIIRLAA